MVLAAGELLGPYEIVAFLGKGGMGEVYRAHDTRLRRNVAIKTSSEHFNERFEREARAIAALNRILWRDSAVNMAIWMMDGPSVPRCSGIGNVKCRKYKRPRSSIADSMSQSESYVEALPRAALSGPPATIESLSSACDTTASELKWNTFGAG